MRSDPSLDWGAPIRRRRGDAMTPRENFIAALQRRQPSGRVPHFELVFYLTMEALGRTHPSHRAYRQWGQMTETERQLHREDMAEVYIATAERFEHSAIFIHPASGADGPEEIAHLAAAIRRRTGLKYFLMTHGDPTYSIPTGQDMTEWCAWLYENTQDAKDKAARRVENCLQTAAQHYHGLLDGVAMCADYCFNTGPFLSLDMFAEVVAPYLKAACAGYRQLGLYTIKHTDGNIMPIIDQLVDAGPDALHSLDPQGGVDIAKVKAEYGPRVALIGNVDCGKLDTGTDEEAAASARYCLRHGMPGGGYIFSTSNCVYTGMRLKRYELIWDIWRKEGNYN
jgi:uroporphyrinogen decarboxylase